MGLQVPKLSGAPARRILRVALLGVTMLVLAGCSEADEHQIRNLAMPDRASAQGPYTYELWKWAWVAAMVTGVIVWGLIFYAVVRFRRRSDDEVPRQTRYNLPLEVFYTIAPVLMCVVFFFHTVRVQDEVVKLDDNPDMTVEVMGQQWSWTFNYGVGEQDPGANPEDDEYAYQEYVYTSGDGNEIPTTPFLGFYPSYTLPPDTGRYRLVMEADATRNPSRTEWDFVSRGTADTRTAADGHLCVPETLPAGTVTGCRVEPLIYLRYSGLGLNPRNEATAPGSQRFEVTAYRQPSATAQPAIAGLKLWISYDGGGKWTRATVKAERDGRFTVSVAHPPTGHRASDTVTIRTEAWDKDGNRVQQTIRDAYRLVHPERRNDEGSFSGFVAGAKQGARIDWIGVSSEFAPQSATNDRTERDGRTPSDHFPVTVVLSPAGDGSSDGR